MQNNERESGLSAEKILAKLYLYFWPFQMFVPFMFLNSIFVGLAKRASFLFLLLGMLVIVFKYGKLTFWPGDSSKLFQHFILMYVVGDVASLIMASILFSTVGTIGGENTFNAVIPKIIFSFAYMVFVYYNREIFRLLTKEEIAHIFDRIITVCIVIGFLQIAVLLIGSPFRQLYDFINSAFGAWSSANIALTKRIALFTIEPATIAGFFGMMAIPYIFSKWISDVFNFNDFVRLVFLVVIIFFTRSTTGYTLLAIDYLVFGFIYLREGEVSLATKALIILLMIVAVGILGYIVVTNEILFGTVTTVFDKLLNSDNTSAMSRKVGLYVNWRIFRRFPLFGVGNGNQGFFYQEFFPESAFSSIWAVQRYNEAATTLKDGGVFFGAFISGYGILGLSFLLGFIRNSLIIMRNNKETYGYLYYFYLIGGIALIINGLSSTLVGDYSAWFLISLPLAVYYWNPERFSSAE